MVKFVCEYCNYLTERQYDFQKHNSSKKHVNKVNMCANIKPASSECNPNIISTNIANTVDEQNKYQCDECGKNFAYRQGLFKHKKACTMSDSEKDKHIEKLKTEIIIKDMQSEIEKIKIQCMQEKIELLNSFKNIAENSSESSKSSCSALNYIIKNYNNAPCIQQFTKFELLTEGNEDYSIAEIAIHKYNINELCTYIGDIIVSEYKTDDPKKQALWTSDVNRLAYLIREVTSNNKVEWFTDKGGIKLSNYIIHPILNHIYDDLIRYYNDKLEDLDIDNDVSESNKKETRNNLITAKSIMKLIKNNQLNDEIVKYIANYLHLDRKTKIKAITYETCNDDQYDIVGGY